MSKNNYIFVTYLNELCSYIIPSDSNSVQNEKSVILFKVTVSFTLFWGNTSQRKTRHAINVTKTFIQFCLSHSVRFSSAMATI